MADILIVEDGVHERERLTKLFNNASYSVQAAESVEEAEKLLNVDQFRLAILDMGLGDKSGSHLFELITRSGKVPYVIILTGNPSVHLKQRFMDEGAAAYIVKASPAAENESLLNTVRGLLGAALSETASGIPLAEFLRLHVSAPSKELFLNPDNSIPNCSKCGASDFIVSFAHRTQLPPLVEGKVICSVCSTEMNPEVG